MIVLLAAVSCKSKPVADYDKLKNFCLSHSSISDFGQYTSVVVITGKVSTCLNCSNIFALDMAKRHIDNQGLLFIISDDGTRVDISGFVNKKNAGNVILDPDNEFGKLGLVKGNAIIDISNHDSLGITEINEANVCSYNIE